MAPTPIVLKHLAAGCDPASRKPYYAQVQRMLAEDQPVSFLYTVKTPLFVNKRLQNVQTSAWIGATPFVACSILDWAVAS